MRHCHHYFCAAFRWRVMTRLGQRVSQICSYSSGIPARLDPGMVYADTFNGFSDPIYPRGEYAVIVPTLWAFEFANTCCADDCCVLAPITTTTARAGNLVEDQARRFLPALLVASNFAPLLISHFSSPSARLHRHRCPRHFVHSASSTTAIACA